jgi:hypothetical protein
VTGEAVKPDAAVTPAPGGEGGQTPAAEVPAAEERVELPSEIAGQTAAQTTCTLPEN